MTDPDGNRKMFDRLDRLLANFIRPETVHSGDLMLCRTDMATCKFELNSSMRFLIRRENRRGTISTMNIFEREGMAAVYSGAALLLALTPSYAQAESGLCPASQRAVFSCAVKDKEVAVCASDDLTETTGRIQYRFGRRTRVELFHPPDGTDWRAVSQGSTLTFSGGGGALMSFENRPYRYIVYTAIGKDWGSKSGVVVERSGRRIAKLNCTTEPVSELGPDLFSKAGIKPFEEPFELP